MEKQEGKRSSKQRPAARWRRQVRYLYLRLLRGESSVQAIARGLAAGVFMGMFPFFGLQTILSVALAFAIRGSKFAAAAGTWVSNPLTYVPIYAFNFEVGKRVLGEEVQAQIDWRSPQSLMELGATVTRSLLVGSFMVGAISAIAAYFLALWLVPRWRRSLKQKKYGEIRDSRFP